MSLPITLLQSYDPHQVHHSFPTRRSSDLDPGAERQHRRRRGVDQSADESRVEELRRDVLRKRAERAEAEMGDGRVRSEEHTSELQSHVNLVCRLLLEKKKNNY